MIQKDVEKRTYFKLGKLFFLTLLSTLIVFVGNSYSQSNDQNNPTPITSNQINGQIKARDIGDSRLTTYYFIFNGNRGDIFINVITSNLNGDIDIFTLEGLRPKTKITLFADNPENETGRVIYMRKPEKLILRIQGRSPNDDPASFQIKFAGSFEQMVAKTDVDQPFIPRIDSKSGTVRVNSVGTIIEEIPDPKTSVQDEPTDSSDKNIDDKSIAAKENDQPQNTTVKDETAVSKTNSKSEIKPEISPVFDPTKSVKDLINEAKPKETPQVIITDSINNTENKLPEKTVENMEESMEIEIDIIKKQSNTSAMIKIEKVQEDDSEIESETVNPLSKIYLKVELKNGKKITRPMTEVLSMNVIKGVLTIVTNDGKIEEYSILDVIKMTIE
jgi:hypothetical protein